MDANLLFDPQDFSQSKLSLSHVLYSLKQESSMSALLCHESDDQHLVD